MSAVNRKNAIEEILSSFHMLRCKIAIENNGRNRKSPLTHSQWLALMTIGKRPHTSLKDLAHELHFSSSAANQLVNELVRLGHVERETDPSDRRAIRITLSEQAKRHISSLKEAGTRKMLSFFKVFNEKEFETYVKLSKKLVTNVEQT